VLKVHVIYESYGIIRFVFVYTLLEIVVNKVF